MRTALENAKITRHLTPHHARHSWSTWHYALNRDLLRLGSNGGWRTTSMCEPQYQAAARGPGQCCGSVLGGRLAVPSYRGWQGDRAVQVARVQLACSL